MKEGGVRILPSREGEDDYVIVVGLGSSDVIAGDCISENRDLTKEKIRTAISAGVRALQSKSLKLIQVVGSVTGLMSTAVRL